MSAVACAAERFAEVSSGIADLLQKGVGAICEVKDMFAGNLQALISGGGGSGGKEEKLTKLEVS